MTPLERAEKIYQKLLIPATSLEHGDPTLLIAAQIEEAEREAVLNDRMKRTADDLYKLSYQSGFKAAREKAKDCESIFCEGFLAAREKAKELAQEEWKRHPIPQINPSENAELTSLRIRDAIKQMEPGE
jgi:hypothetical protein